VSAPGIVIVDKPTGMTSHDVVGRCRRIFGTRKVGHAGTLDPMATGVLVVGVERATKILGLLAATSKSYAATIRLGRATSTDDAEGEVRQDVSAMGVTDDALMAGVAALRGEISQRPSAVSAVKIGGKRAYQLAREGQRVELAARAVRVDRFDVLAVRRDGPFLDVEVEVDCSSGTYIRALARDLGEALGVGGHLTALRRTRVGGYGLDHVRTLAELAEHPTLSYSLDEACLLAFPRRDITAEQAVDAGHGRPLPAAGIDGPYAATDPAGRVIALLEDRGAATKSVVVIRPATLGIPFPARRCEHGDMTGTPSIPSAGSIAVADLIAGAVVRVSADATVAEVARLIAENEVGAVVVGGAQRPAAIMTERDVVRVVAAGRDPSGVPAIEVASTTLIWCEAHETVATAAIRMTDHSIRHLLVERDGALAGIVSARDLLGVYATDADQL